MYKKRVFLALVLFISILFYSNISTVLSSDLPCKNELIELEKEIPEDIRSAMDNQTEAWECYQKLFDWFPRDEIGNPIFPNEYAGAYIENGKLIYMQKADGSQPVDGGNIMYTTPIYYAKYAGFETKVG